MTLAAASLRTRITIEQRVAGVDTYGQPVETWATVAATWADVRAMSGRAAAEMLAADRQVSASPYSMRIRWRAGITAAMRVTVSGVTYDIREVLQDVARREYIDLVCTTGAIQG